MPRRRGEYTLAKSTSFTTILPFANFTNNSFYSMKNTDQGSYKTKLFLNTTITPDNCATIINDTYANANERQQQLAYQQKQSREGWKKMTKSDRRDELPQLFSQNFINDHEIRDQAHGYTRNKRHHCRTVSNASSFQNSLKYSFEKMKLRTTSVKYAKPETEAKSIDEMIISLMNLMPVTSMAKTERNHLPGNRSWKKLRKVQRSRSGARKLSYQI